MATVALPLINNGSDEKNAGLFRKGVRGAACRADRKYGRRVASILRQGLTTALDRVFNG